MYTDGRLNVKVCCVHTATSIFGPCLPVILPTHFFRASYPSDIHMFLPVNIELLELLSLSLSLVGFDTHIISGHWSCV